MDNELRDFFESIPPDIIQRQNEIILEQQYQEYKKFEENLEKGMCYLCNHNINSFDEDIFCFHWFTYPTGIKKKHFEKHLKGKPNFGFFNLDAYFRWLANSDNFIGNINDLTSEISEKSFLETTYKYKNIQWAFSIGNSDLEGHEKSKNGEFPHYHVEMKIDNQIFIKFNDFHLPFNSEDLFKIRARKEIPDLIYTDNLLDTGMSFLEDEKNLEIIDDMIEVTSDYENATLNYQSVFITDENNPLTSEILQEAIRESERTKKPIGMILQEKLKSGNVIISPGEGVPKMSKRSGKK